MLKEIKIFGEMFKVEPLFVFDCTWEELQEHLIKEYRIKTNLSWIGDATGTVMNLEPDIHRLVWLKEFKRNSPESIAVLVHEITHLCTRICYDKGVVILMNDGVADEPLAYMIDFFTKKFLEEHKKICQKKRQK